MGVSGNLRTMLPGDLLQWLSLSQKTGTLVVTKKEVEKRVYFKKGRILSSASNEPRDYLGQFLISHGFISEAELKKAMEVQRHSGILLGKILVTIGAIGEEDLLRLMRLKAEEAVYDVFLWNGGEFRFIDDELPQMDLVPLRVDVAGIVAEGMRRLDEWGRIREVIADNCVVPSISGPFEGDPSEATRTIVAAIDGHRTIEDIVLESRSSNFIVSETIYRMMKSGTVRLQAPDKRAEAAPPIAVFASDLSDAEEIGSLVTRAEEALVNGQFENAQRLLRAAQSLDPAHQGAREALAATEARIVSSLREQGLTDNRIPSVVDRDQRTADLTPNEGFLLSRINGSWDIGSLVKISPIRETDALLIFHKLWKEGVIALGVVGG